MKKILCIIVGMLCLLPLGAKVKLPAIIGNDMVLQQNTNVNLWGWATRSRKITVRTSWDNKNYTTTSASDGTWKIQVQTPSAGGPYTITISDGEPVTLTNVLIGEVWLCSGQSNMEMRMMGNTAQPIDNSLETLLNAGNYRDRIRFITVPRIKDVQRRADFKKEKWKVSTPETTIDCSATAYFFEKYR